MTLLSDRWSGFRRVPWVQLAELPTPVELAEELSSRVGAQIWIKRDDLTARLYGGNKVRKLEFLLGEALAQEADTLITAGAAGSHHALATTLFGARLGLHVHACTFPQRYSAHAEAHLKALVHAGADVHPVRGGALAVPRMTAIAARERLRRRRPALIPPGGSNVAGAFGHVEAGLELARQMEGGVLEEPDAIFVPLGTGGTLAGLAIGLAAAGITARLIGVRVVPRSIGNQTLLGSLIKRTVRELRGLDERFPDVAAAARDLVELDHEEYGGGYGEPTSSGRNAGRLARQHATIELDPTYTQKAFASVLRHARGELRGRRLLFHHTLSAAPPPGLEDAPPLRPRLRRLLRR